MRTDIITRNRPVGEMAMLRQQPHSFRIADYPHQIHGAFEDAEPKAYKCTGVSCREK
jgi:hypothetical protein